jgi:hypothetical protein
VYVFPAPAVPEIANRNFAFRRCAGLKVI